MGTKVGHVSPGIGFLVIGLVHLFSHIRLYCISPNSYIAPSWFPSPFLHRYLEQILIILGSLLTITMDMSWILQNKVVGPADHLPLNHLRNFEHTSISVAFLAYATFTVAFDRARARLRDEMIILLGAVAFAQELLMFHLHSTDHAGVEGQYHWLLQLIIVASLATTLLGVRYRRSLPVSFVRSASIAFQGVWFIVVGYALGTPSLVPEGCFMKPDEDGQYAVRCHSEVALERAKALVNLQFSWCMIVVAVFSMSLYLFLDKIYSGPSEEKPRYKPLDAKEITLSTGEDEDLQEPQKKAESKSLILP